MKVPEHREMKLAVIRLAEPLTSQEILNAVADSLSCAHRTIVCKENAYKDAINRGRWAPQSSGTSDGQSVLPGSRLGAKPRHESAEGG